MTVENALEYGEGGKGRSLLGRFLDYLDWKINPVLLRDLRLYTRGRLLLASYFFIVAGLVCLGVLYVLIAGREEEDGRALVSILTVILCLGVGAFVPSLVYERFRTELANRATELALMSSLTPARLVRGKLIGAWCVSLIIVSTSAPVYATAYLLGGVNLFAILGCVGGVMAAAAVMPTAQLFLASQGKHRALSRGTAGVLFVVQIILMSSYSSFLLNTFARARLYSLSQSALFASLLIAGVLIAQFLYFVTVSRLRAESENRDAAPRLSLVAAAYTGGFLAMAIILWVDGHSRYRARFSFYEALSPVVCFVAIAFCAGFVLVAHSSPTPPRNSREIYRGKPLRRLFLQPGVRSLCMCLLANAAVMLGTGFVCALVTGETDSVRFLCLGAAPFLAVFYGMAAYYYLVLPLVKNVRNPGLLPATIVVANVILGLASTFFYIVVAMGDDRIFSYPLLLAATPVGILLAVVESGQAAVAAAHYLPFFLGFAMLALLPILLGGVDRRLGAEAVAADEA